MYEVHCRSARAAAVAIAAIVFTTAPSAAQDPNPTITRSWTQPSPAATARTEASPAAATVKPVITRDLDGPNRQPTLNRNNFWSLFAGLGDGSGGCARGFSGLTAGGRLIIELISVKIAAKNPLTGPYIVVGASLTGGLDESTAAGIYVPLQSQGQHTNINTTGSGTSSYYNYVGTLQVNLRLESDEWLCERIYTGPTFQADATAKISYFGYTLDPP